MNRTNEPLKRWAHRILDEVRAGIPHTQSDVNKALAALGEPLQ
jgi:hypothetical protein